jgi:hypothetical protein
VDWATLPAAGIGLVSTTYLGIRQSRTTIQVAEQQINAQVQVAQEERRQRRIEAAYEKLQAVVIELDDYLQAVTSETMKGVDPRDADLREVLTPRLSGQRALALYWSPRVRQLVGKAQDEMRLLNSVLGIYQDVRKGDHSDEERFSEWSGMIFQAAESRKAIEAVRDQMSAELNPGAPGREGRALPEYGRVVSNWVAASGWVP